MKDPREKKTPPNRSLHFKKGDLLIKEGDYGISVYKVLQGRVGIFTEVGEKEIGIAVVGPGEVVGEMTFLYSGTIPRTASVRALEDVNVEVWHPATLTHEYESMPPMIKYIVNQVLARLLRMNKLVGRLSERGGKPEVKLPERETPTSQRQYYRKSIDRPCNYRPLKAAQRVALEGRMKDLSFKGVGMEIPASNMTHAKHAEGDEFYVHLVLPNDKEVNLTVKLVHIRECKVPGRILLGMEIVDIDDASRKTLGFFLMP